VQNFNPIGPPFAKKFANLCCFFLSYNFFLFSKVFLLNLYTTSGGKFSMTANSKKFLQIFQFVALNLRLSNFVIMKFDCCASVIYDKINRSFNTSNSQWPQFAKFLQTSILNVFSFKQDKKWSLLWRQIRDGQQARWKKAKCNDGNFAIITIREILQKLISTFFWTSSKTKECEVSWWRFRDGHYSRNFAKIIFDFILNAKQDERKRNVMMAVSWWSPIAKFCKN